MISLGGRLKGGLRVEQLACLPFEKIQTHAWHMMKLTIKLQKLIIPDIVPDNNTIINVNIKTQFT